MLSMCVSSLKKCLFGSFAFCFCIYEKFILAFKIYFSSFIRVYLIKLDVSEVYNVMI